MHITNLTWKCAFEMCLIIYNQICQHNWTVMWTSHTEHQTNCRNSIMESLVYSACLVSVCTIDSLHGCQAHFAVSTILRWAHELLFKFSGLQPYVRLQSHELLDWPWEIIAFVLINKFTQFRMHHIGIKNFASEIESVIIWC